MPVHNFLFTELPTEVLKPLEDCEVFENETGHFQCAFSKPDLKVRWKRNNRDISNSEKYIIKVDKNNYFLQITNAELKDDAEYTCDCGDAKTVARFCVKGKNVVSYATNGCN